MLMGPQLTSLLGHMGALHQGSDSAQTGSSRQSGNITRLTATVDSKNTMQNQAIQHRQGAANVGFAASRLSTASAGLSQASKIVNEMQGLATQANDDSLNNNDRAVLDKQFQSLAGELTALSDNTSFNGHKVLEGSDVTTHTGEHSITLSDPDLSASAAALSSSSLSSAADASAAMKTLEAASTDISSQISTLGATQSGLERAMDASLLTAANLENSGEVDQVKNLASHLASSIADKISTVIAGKALEVQKTTAKDAIRVLTKSIGG